LFLDAGEEKRRKLFLMKRLLYPVVNARAASSSGLRGLYFNSRQPPASLYKCKKIRHAFCYELLAVLRLTDENYSEFYFRLSPNDAVNALRLGCKTSQLMLYKEIIAVCFEIKAKYIT
jgi:hypothetical protein